MAALLCSQMTHKRPNGALLKPQRSCGSRDKREEEDGEDGLMAVIILSPSFWHDGNNVLCAATG